MTNEEKITKAVLSGYAQAKRLDRYGSTTVLVERFIGRLRDIEDISRRRYHNIIQDFDSAGVHLNDEPATISSRRMRAHKRNNSAHEKFHNLTTSIMLRQRP